MLSYESRDKPTLINMLKDKDLKIGELREKISQLLESQKREYQRIIVTKGTVRVITTEHFLSLLSKHEATL
jgi:UDP-glucose 6-dehydrogenase